MITIVDVKPSAVFVSEISPDYRIKIINVFDGDVTFSFKGQVLYRNVETVVDFINKNQYKPELKPLDQAMKVLDKVYCSHKNIVKDTWFNSRVYKHCKDCGKAID